MRLPDMDRWLDACAVTVLTSLAGACVLGFIGIAATLIKWIIGGCP